jgi:hypothetical protein
MIDLGQASFPVFFDENADGLTDIIAGSFGYFQAAGEYDSRLMLLRNTGTAKIPAFEVVSTDYAGLGKFGFEGIYPSFGDMDGDGDKDMIIGDEEGKLHFFLNEAGPNDPAQFTLTEPNYKNIDAGESAKPQITDVDRDGLNDLLVGERSGTIKYFENTGSPENADFSAQPTLNKLGGIDVMPECCTGYSAPFMTTDSLGNSILYVGSEQGFIYLYDNIDENLTGAFNLVDSLYLHGVNVNVSGRDINEDGRMEFVFGQFTGGLGLLKFGKPPVLGIKDNLAKASLEFRLFPNPVNDEINISPGSDNNQPVEVSVINILGQTLVTQRFSPGNKIRLDVSFLNPGIYFLSSKIGGKEGARKFVKNSN